MKVSDNVKEYVFRLVVLLYLGIGAIFFKGYYLDNPNEVFMPNTMSRWVISYIGCMLFWPILFICDWLQRGMIKW